MYELTGLDSLDWVILGLITTGLVVAAFALIRAGGPVRYLLLGAGVVSVALGLAAQFERTVDGLIDAVTTFPAFAILGVMVGCVVALAWAIGRRLPMDALGRTIVLGAVLLVGISIAAFFLVSEARTPIEGDIEPGPQATAPFLLGWTLQLAGHPTGLAFDAATNTLYVALGQGEIVRVVLEADLKTAPQPAETVASGLIFPRGLAVIGSSLYAVETGDLPCDTVFPTCNKHEVNVTVPGASEDGPEALILEQSRSRILEYTLGPSGELTVDRTLLGDLPVANTDHAVNGMKPGPDGELYVSIGNIDSLIYSMPEFEAVTHPNKDLLGTLLRINPADASYEVVARGLRNVFGITLDPIGVVWGVDNDGGSLRGLRREEVLRIVDGAHFGFPYDGSSPPFTVRTDPPAFTRNDDIVGSGGTEWIRGVGNHEGLMLGGLGGLSFLRLAFIDGAYRVPEATKPLSVIGSWGWPVAIESVGPNALVYAEYGPNVISLLTWSSD